MTNDVADMERQILDLMQDVEHYKDEADYWEKMYYKLSYIVSEQEMELAGV